MAWGSHAQKMCSGVDKVSFLQRQGTQCIQHRQSGEIYPDVEQNKHLILRSVHPSPLAANKGFFGNEHFKKANAWLEERYGPDGGINWRSLGSKQ